MSVMTATRSIRPFPIVSIDRYEFNRYMYIDGRRFGACAQDEASCRTAVLRAGRVPRRRARARAPHGRGGEGPRRPGPPSAGGRAPQARRQGLRVRARATVRHLTAHALAPSQEAARGRHRRLRAARPLGLLLRQPRCTGGAVRMAELTDIDIRERVRERYADAASDPSSGCCGRADPDMKLTDRDGTDVLISARRVGDGGKAIGLDMTDEMLEVARANAAEAGVANVEFLKGYLEDIPLADETVDVVISNCVINLAADKRRVIAEAARVLRPGGPLAISGGIAAPDKDEATRPAMQQWTGCIAGALTPGQFEAMLSDEGLTDIEIRETHRVHEHAGSAIVRARKPRADDGSTTPRGRPARA